MTLFVFAVRLEIFVTEKRRAAMSPCPSLRLSELPSDVLCVFMSSLRSYERHVLRCCCAIFYALPPAENCRLRLALANWNDESDHLTRSPRFWGLLSPTIVLCVRSFDATISEACIAACARLAAAGAVPDGVCVLHLHVDDTMPSVPDVMAVVNSLAECLPWPLASLEVRGVWIEIRVTDFSEQARSRLSWCDAVLCVENDNTSATQTRRPPPFPLLRNLNASMSRFRASNSVAEVYGPDPDVLPCLEYLSMGPMDARNAHNATRIACMTRHPQLRTIAFPGGTACFCYDQIFAVDLGGLSPDCAASNVMILRAEMLTAEAMQSSSMTIELHSKKKRFWRILAKKELNFPNLRQLRVSVYRPSVNANDRKFCVALLRAAPRLEKLALDTCLLNAAVVRALPSTLRKLELGWQPRNDMVARLLVGCPVPFRVFSSIPGVPRVFNRRDAWLLTRLADPGPPNPWRRVELGSAFDPTAAPPETAPAWNRHVKEFEVRLPLARGFSCAIPALVRQFSGVTRLRFFGTVDDDLIQLCIALGPRLITLFDPWRFNSRPPERFAEVRKACPWLRDYGAL